MDKRAIMHQMIHDYAIAQLSRLATELSEHEGEEQCWNCWEWRPDDAEECPHCGVDAVPF